MLDSIPVDSKSAIAELIDLNPDDNMKEVINEIRSLRKDTDSKFSILYWVLGTIGAIIISSCVSLLIVFLR